MERFHALVVYTGQRGTLIEKSELTEQEDIGMYRFIRAELEFLKGSSPKERVKSKILEWFRHINGKAGFIMGWKQIDYVGAVKIDTPQRNEFDHAVRELSDEGLISVTDRGFMLTSKGYQRIWGLRPAEANS